MPISAAKLSSDERNALVHLDCTERLTGESCDVLNEITGVGNDHDDKDEGGPQADPTTKIHIIIAVSSIVMTESRIFLLFLLSSVSHWQK